MKKTILSLVILAATVPAFARGPRDAKKKEAQRICKEQGLAGPELKVCIKEQMKKKK